MEYERKFYSDYDLETYHEYELVEGNKIIINGLKLKIERAENDGFWVFVPKRGEQECE